MEEKLDWEQRARRLAKELSETQKLQIEIEAVQHFRDLAKYLDKLTYYGTIMYIKWLDDMAKLMTERRVEVAVSILVEARAPFKAFMSSTQTVWVKVPDVIPTADEDWKVRSQWPPKKKEDPCPLFDLATFDDILGEDPLWLIG